jgi:hypothetical protein
MNSGLRYEDSGFKEYEVRRCAWKRAVSGQKELRSWWKNKAMWIQGNGPLRIDSLPVCTVCDPGQYRVN